MDIIEKIGNGNVQLSRNGKVVENFLQDSTAAPHYSGDYVNIVRNSRTISNIPFNRQYSIQYNDNTIVFNPLGQTAQDLATILMETVFAEDIVSEGNDVVPSSDNSFSTLLQSDIVDAQVLGTLYFLRGIQALEDVKVKITSIGILPNNNKKYAIYLVKAPALSSLPDDDPISSSVRGMLGDESLAIVNQGKRVKTIIVSGINGVNEDVNIEMDLAKDEIFGLLIEPGQSNVNARGIINFQQL